MDKKQKICFWITATLVVIAGIATGLYRSCYGEPKSEVSCVDLSIQTDSLYMNSAAEKYLWFEVDAVLSAPLNELDSLSFESSENIYQTVEATDSATQVTTWIFRHGYITKTDSIEKVNEAWMEDLDMRHLGDSLISFKDAFDIVMKADIVKPHTRHMVLRNAVGPKLAHPHFIFGNGDLFVDAITGEVTTKDPWKNEE